MPPAARARAGPGSEEGKVQRAMVRIAVLAEHAWLAILPAQKLREDNRLQVTAVAGERPELELPGARQAIAAAQALVYVATQTTESLPWPEVQPGPDQAVVILDIGGHVGVERAVRLGARGYLGPDDAEAEWAPRVLQAAEGKFAFPPGSIAALGETTYRALRLALGVDRLSPAQLAAVRLYAGGLQPEAIARELGISATAARRRLARSCQVLGVDSLQELAVLAGKAGLDAEENDPPTDT